MSNMSNLRRRLFAREAELDPADQSLAARQIREAAGSARDHEEMERRRAEWAQQDAQRGHRS
jgi:hypothetical protein